MIHPYPPAATDLYPSKPVKTDPIPADLVIVGGGIVGATLACSFARQGLRVWVVDVNPAVVGLKNQRAYALTLLTIDIFRGLGIWDDIKTQTTGFQEICLSDAQHPATVRFQPRDLGRWELGYVAEHRVILQALYQRIAQAQNIHWLAPAQVDSMTLEGTTRQVKVTLPNGETLTLATPLVVAADGAQSPTRTAAGIKTWGWKYWQSCIGFTVKLDTPHEEIAYEKFWPSGPFAMLPLPQQRYQVVWTAPHAEAQSLVDLPEPEFLRRLAQRFNLPPEDIHLETPRRLFPVRLMQSQTYIAPRLALMGDAAHCCHPVGGQGMNLGIRDAAALAELLHHALDHHQDWGEGALLRRYDHWRRWENQVILTFTDMLDRTFSNTLGPIVLLRGLGLWGLRHFKVLRYLALRLMTGQFGRPPQLAQAPQQKG
jgi:2-octaprenyl-6-methoxyphenol hydroxylase